MFWVLSVLVAALFATANATYNVTAKTYYMDTSQPASVYMKELCEEQAVNAERAFPIMLDMLPEGMQPSARKLAMEYWNSGAVIEPYRSEIEYFSQCSTLSLEDIMTVNIIYDLTAFCTSIVAVKPDGTILHARNQDFPTVLRNDTVNMVFTDGNNKTLYAGTNFVGYVGIPTGIKYGAFSISIDARFTLVGLEDWFDIYKGNFPAGWLVRECLIKDDDFDACVERLSTTKLQAPIYYIVAGTDGTMDGAVITRNQTAVNGPIHNGPNEPLYLKNSEHGWYLVETNFDWWTFAKDNRRENAIKMLDSVGQENIDMDTLFEILSTPPVLASDTVYTTRMSPSNYTYFNTQIRFDTRNKEPEQHGVGEE